MRGPWKSGQQTSAGADQTTTTTTPIEHELQVRGRRCWYLCQCFRCRRSGQALARMLAASIRLNITITGSPMTIAIICQWQRRQLQLKLRFLVFHLPSISLAVGYSYGQPMHHAVAKLTTRFNSSGKIFVNRRHIKQLIRQLWYVAMAVDSDEANDNDNYDDLAMAVATGRRHSDRHGRCRWQWQRRLIRVCTSGPIVRVNKALRVWRKRKSWKVVVSFYSRLGPPRLTEVATSRPSVIIWLSLLNMFVF